MPTDLTLSNKRGFLKCNGEEVMSGNTKNFLGNPLSAVAWLVNRLSDYDIEFKAKQFICREAAWRLFPWVRLENDTHL
ncbi:hypothetical protein BDW66DRAFT_137614 [Aspergillus desertorum]